MTTLLTDCPWCQLRVRVEPLEVVLGEHAYFFSCPECEQLTGKPANDAIREALLRAGVAPTYA